jgi:hypothetical protein
VDPLVTAVPSTVKVARLVSELASALAAVAKLPMPGSMTSNRAARTAFSLYRPDFEVFLVDISIVFLISCLT